MNALVSLLTALALRLLRMALRSRLVMTALALSLGGGALHGGIASDVGERVQQVSTAARANLPDLERPRLPSLIPANLRGGEAPVRTSRCREGLDDVKVIRISRERYPETTDHFEDAIRIGKPWKLTYGGPGTSDRNRRASTDDLPAVGRLPDKLDRYSKDFERDEYSVAASLQGGEDAHVRYVSGSDNGGAGGVLGAGLRGLERGDAFCLQAYGQRRRGWNSRALRFRAALRRCGCGRFEVGR